MTVRVLFHTHNVCPKCSMSAALTSAVLTLLVSCTRTFLQKDKQPNASRSVERGELCLCLMSMHLWQEEAHHTDFLWHQRVHNLRSRFPITNLSLCVNAKTFSPCCQHLTAKRRVVFHVLLTPLASPSVG